MIKSKTITRAGVISRNADFLEFRTDNKITAVSNTQRIGAVTVSQLVKGTDFPTVQGAINDLMYRTELPVNTVISNTDGLVPGFIQQYDQWTFTGTILPVESTSVDGDPVIINFLGFTVRVKVGDTSAEVVAAVFDVLNEASINQKAISSVEVDPSDTSILNIKYIDYQSHIFNEVQLEGITATQLISVNGRSGYGTWERMGTQEITLAGGSVNGPITLYYFKRIE